MCWYIDKIACRVGIFLKRGATGVCVRAISFTFHLIHKRNGENDQQNGRVNLLRLVPLDFSLLMFFGGIRMGKKQKNKKGGV